MSASASPVAGEGSRDALAELRGITHRYENGFCALSGVGFEVRSGEVLGLVGPNGAGKTTLVRILCGLMRPSEGNATVGGADVHSSPLEAKRHFAFVPDGAPLYSNLSPRSHLALVGRLHGLDEAAIRSEGDRMLAELGLADRADDPVGPFSHGMRQKTALACALLAHPRLLVLDEPLSGLDAPTTAVVKEILRTWADGGRSVLYTSHLLDVVERVCDRVAILARGELIALGTLAELRQRSGQEGTLEEVFRAVTDAEDPAAQARRILGV